MANDSQIMNKLDIGGQVKHISQTDLENNIDAFAEKYANEKVYVTNSEGAVGSIPISQLKQALGSGYSLYDDTQGYLSREDVKQSMQPEQNQPKEQLPEAEAEKPLKNVEYNDGWRGSIPQIAHSLISDETKNALKTTMEAIPQTPMIPGQTPLEYGEKVAAVADEIKKREDEKREEYLRQMALPETVKELDLKIADIDKQLKEYEQPQITMNVKGEMVPNLQNLFNPNRKTFTAEQVLKKNELEQQKQALTLQRRFLDRIKEYQQYDKEKDLSKLDQFFRAIDINGDLQTFAAFGLNEIKQNQEFQKILDKAERITQLREQKRAQGDLSPVDLKLTFDEKKALILYNNMLDIASKDRGIWFNAGAGMPKTFEFIRDVALAGIGGGFPALAKIGFKTALKQAGKSLAKRVVDIAWKTPLLPGFYSTLSENKIGNYNVKNYGTNENPAWYVGQKDSTEWLLYKSWAQQATEYFTESLGSALESIGLLTRIAKGASKSKKIIGTAARQYDKIHKTMLRHSIGKYVVGGLGKLGINSFPMEFIEEIANVPLQSLALQENKMSQLGELRFYQEILISTAAVGGVGSAVNIATGGATAAIERKRSNKAIKDCTDYINKMMSQTEDQATKDAFQTLIDDLSSKNFYNEDGDFDGGKIVDDINAILPYVKNDKVLLQKVEELVKESVYREGQTEALKDIVESELGEIEYGTSGDVLFGADINGNRVFILGETDDAYLVNYAETKEQKLVPKSDIVATTSIPLDIAVTNYFTSKTFKSAGLESIEDIDQAQQEVAQQVEKNEQPLKRGDKAMYDNQAVVIEDIYTDANGQAVAIVMDNNDNPHNVPLADLTKPDIITDQDRYMLPDGRRATVYAYDGQGNVIMNILDDNNEVVAQQTYPMDEMATFEKLPAQQAKAVEQTLTGQQPTSENAQQGQQPEQPEKGEAETPTETQAVPRNEQGQIMWTAMPVERTVQEINSRFEQQDAVDYVNDMRNDAQKEVEKAEKLKPESLDPDTRAQELEAIKQQKAQAQANLDYWNKVYDAYQQQPNTAEQPEPNTSEQQSQTPKQAQSVDIDKKDPFRKRVADWVSKGFKITILESKDQVTNAAALAQIEAADAKRAAGIKESVSGWFDPDTNTTYVYMPHVESVKDIDLTIIHEVVAHKGLRALLGEERYETFCLSVWDSMSKDAQDYYMQYPGVNGNKAKAADEYIAYLAEKINLTPEEQTIWDRIIERFRQFMQQVLDTIVDKNFITDEDIATLIRMSYANIKHNATPDVIYENKSNGQAIFSIRTYREGGRAKLVSFLEDRKVKGALTEQQADDIIKQADDIYGLCENYLGVYQPFGAWSEAEVAVDDSGKPVFSVIKANGDYNMNLDFSLVCKKRRTLDAVFDEMIRRGIISEYELGQLDIALINNIIRKYDFETACRLCFVDSRRFQVAAVADNFCAMYNNLVAMNNSQLDKVIASQEKDTVLKKAATHLKYHPEDRVPLSRDNFMSASGFENVSINKAAVMKLYNSAKGTGGPKASLGDVQYLNDIIGKNWTPEKAYAVGGVRLQSFSDYIPRMVFDYVQMVSELAAKLLPVHCYTKESIFVKQFGLTGIKINMSLVPRVDADGVAAGLDKDGNYAWQEGETFPYDIALEIQNTPGYMENCGTIAVGVSDRHIRKMLADENIRMIIPYHKSGLNKQVAIFNNIDKFTDYTKVQNTRYANGNALSDEDKAKHFDFNGDLVQNQDPRGAAQRYLDWCDSHNYLPKFDQFRDHPNYYKLLEDFTTIITKDGVDTVVPQGPVQMKFPTENDAFGSMASLIEQGLEEDAVLEGRRSELLPAIVDEIQVALDESKKQKEEAARKKKAGKKKQPKGEVKFRVRTEKQKKALFDKSKEIFGTTNNFKVAGYMLPDGSLLDFSGKWEGGPSDRRYTDHRAIGSGLYEASELDSNYNTDMYDFINSGAIRLMPEVAGIYVAQPLTEAQEDRLANYIYRNNGEVILEITNENGDNIAYIEYNKRTSAEKVLSDIDNYFSKGIKPVQPEVRFRTSYTPEMEAIKDKAEKDGTFMKAPNGLPTKLNEKQWLQVRTEAFKNWFGDWENDPENASKVVDPETGEPKVVYHGTGSKFWEFKYDSDANELGAGYYFTDDEVLAHRYAEDIELADNQKKLEDLAYNIFIDMGHEEDDLYDNEYVEDYNKAYDQAEKELFGQPNVIPVFLNIKNPYRLNDINPYNARSLAAQFSNDGIIDTAFAQRHETLSTDGVQYSVFNSNQIKSATDNTGEFSTENDDIRFRTNAKFNEDLQKQIDGILPKGYVYQLGMPGNILLSTGIANLPIQLNSTRLQDKSVNYGHDFNLNEIKDLVFMLNEPLAVFAYGDQNKSQNIVVELQKDDKHFIVGLFIKPTVNGKVLEINSIRNIFPKDSAEWLNWIAQGKALYLDKSKIQTLIDQQRTNLADVEYLDLDSITKLINDFENPTIVEDQSLNEVNFRTTTGKEVSFRQVDITGQKLRELKDGEFCHVERIFTESKYFDFTAGETIESANDVAYIFSQLEDESVENSFAVLVKDGKPYVIHVGMGNFDSTVFNLGAVIAADKLINADKIYMVHNHPSGQLKASRADVMMWNNFKKAFGERSQDGIIINLTTGKFGSFNDQTASVEVKNTPESQIPVKVYSFNKQVFDYDYDPQNLKQITGSHDVASFVSGQRLGDRAKLSTLILSRDNRVVGNMFMPYSSTNMTTKKVDALAGSVVDYVLKMGGTSAIMYGSGVDTQNSKSLKNISDAVKRLSGDTIQVLDFIHVDGNAQKYESAMDEGVMFRVNSLDLQNQSNDQINGTRITSKTQESQAENLARARDAVADRQYESSNANQIGDQANSSSVVYLSPERTLKTRGDQNILINNGVDLRNVFDNILGSGNSLWRVYADKHNDSAYAVLTQLQQVQKEARRNDGYATDNTFRRLLYAIRQSGDGALLIRAMRGDVNESSQINTIDKNSRLGKIGIESGVYYGIDTLIDIYKRFNFKDQSIDALAVRVFDVAKNLNLGVIFSNELFSEDIVGAYNDNNIIRIKSDYINSPITTAKKAKCVLLHEAIHAVTSYALDAKPYVELPTAMKEAVDELKSIYNSLIKKNRFKDFYAAKDVNEMVAELANPDFRQYLKSIGWFKRIINAVAKLFVSDIQTSPDTLEQIESALNKLINSFDLDLYRKYNHIDNIDSSIEDGNISFRYAPVFQSNALNALKSIKQDKATPLQWIAMLKNNGGLKAGEDKWIGLSDWLNQQSNNVTKQQIQDYIRQNEIQVVDENYVAPQVLLHKAVDELYGPGFAHGFELDNGFVTLYDMGVAARMYDIFGQETAKKIGIEKLDEFVNLVENEVKEYLDENYSNAKFPNNVRLQYTTIFLENNSEIALVVPSVESWNAHDKVHFGDAGNGRAVAWVRFGETFDKDGKSVLVIDEVQSKRHQDAREKGYAASVDEVMKSTERFQEFNKEMKLKYGENNLWDVEDQLEFNRLRNRHSDLVRSRLKGVPSAPFEKNWHELAMKRMLRYAAENGYEKIAWTTGAQQAERYDLGHVVDEIWHMKDKNHFNLNKDGYSIGSVRIDKEGVIVEGTRIFEDQIGNPLSDVVGKELANRMINSQPNDEIKLGGQLIGGEGMKGFYDKMLVDFMNKYGKKWGVKVEDVELPNIGDRGLTMHSVEVTDSMKNSVLNESQVMFRHTAEVVTPSDIAAKGLVGVLGQEKFDNMVRDIFEDLPLLDKAAYIKRGQAPAQVVAQIADDIINSDKVDQVQIQQVLMAIKDALIENGPVVLPDNADMLFHLWKGTHPTTAVTIKEKLEQKAQEDKIRFRASQESPVSTNEVKLSRRQVWQERLVDRMISLKEFYDQLEKLGVKVSDDLDPYVTENLAMSRSQTEDARFKDEIYEPMIAKVVEIEKMFVQLGLAKDLKDAYKKVSDFLYARHAPERNKQICIEEIVDKMLRKISKEEMALFKDENVRKALMAFASRLYNERYNPTTPKTSSSFAKNLLKTKGEDKAQQLLLKSFVIKFGGIIDEAVEDMNKIFKSEKGTNRSGMSDAEAKEIMNNLYTPQTKEILDELSELVRQATHFTIDTWYKYSLINEKTKNDLKAMYKYYIPLRSWEEKEDIDYEQLATRAFNRASEIINLNRKARGRGSRAGDPLAYIASLAQSAIVVGNKNMIRLNLFRLIKNNQGVEGLDQFATLPKVYYVELPDSNETIAYTERPAQELFDKGLVETKTNKAYKWHKSHAEYDAHIVPVIINGTRQMIELRGELGIKVASAVNNTNVVHWQAANALKPLTNWLSAVRTSYNPEFVLTNFVRDFMFANLVYPVEGGSDKKLIINLGHAFKAIHRLSSGKSVNSEWDAYYQEFLSEGGQTGFFTMRNIDQMKKEIEVMHKRMHGGKMNRHNIAKNAKKLAEYTNNLSESAMRLAVYITERQNGVSPKQAAYKAHEISVNFNRKGTWSSNFGAFYSFFNASVQGTARLFSWANKYKKGAATALTAIALTKLATNIIAAAVGGDDYDELSDYVKFSNIVIPVGKDDEGKTIFFCIPMAQGIRAVTNISDNIVEVFTGNKTVGQAMHTQLLNMMGEFLPLSFDAIDLTGRNTSYSFAVPFMPTAVQPLMDIWTNTDFKGDPIYKEPFLKSQEGFLPEFNNVYKGTSRVLVGVSKYLNRAAGGSDLRSSAVGVDKEGNVYERPYGYAFDRNPAKVEHLLNAYLGGFMTLPSNLVDVTASIFDPDEDVQARDLPVVNRFFKKSYKKDGYEIYYETKEFVDMTNNSISAARKSGDLKGAATIQKRNAEIIKAFKAYDDRVKQLNELLKKADISTQQSERLEAQRDEIINKAAQEFQKIMKDEENSRD